ncbi:GNAT family N-acetyltransferase [Lactobacillus sp. ESL0791]|uniref:GNAT family N-acetyltransferase n=1 Tax=Lactobacillus sp. ESL0791 TaxID=2983234 RepID=UPI0023FA47E1|nr:GNAT family N-acetyltransferase [Lactobacillus sp. ESL0791]MDF7639503.1 GNAT family N-acetyltransferase [Lactobacillus sp. ESL0791]
MDTKLQLYELTDKDLAQTADLFIHTFTQPPWCEEYESREQVINFFAAYMKSNYFVGYILKDGEEIIALSIGFKKPWIKGMEYYIDEFCVAPEYQGQGVGSNFLKLIDAAISTKGMTGMILNTGKGYPAEQFYLKNGFTQLEDLIVLAKVSDKN